MRKIILYILILISFSATAYAKPLKFIQLTDIHLSPDGSGARAGINIEKSVEILQNGITAINKIPDIDFVVFSGDNINKANEDDLRTFCEIVGKLNKPYYITIGNHDVFKSNGLGKSKFFEIVRTYNKNQKNKKTCFYFQPDNKFAVVLMEGSHEYIPSKRGSYTEENLAWLNNVLNKFKNKKVIIVQHFPLIEPSDNRSHRILSTVSYFNLLSHHSNVAAILSGHYHSEKITYKDGIAHISTPAFGESPYFYRLIEMDVDKNLKLDIKTELVPLGVLE